MKRQQYDLAKLISKLDWKEIQERVADFVK